MAHHWSADPASTGVDGQEFPPVEDYRDLATDLDDAVAGSIRFDEYAQVMYATDGSIYQARPAGVVFPTNVEDVLAAVDVATDHDVPILPRGAGSSLAGQAVGPGCVVLDFSRHMNDILDVDTDSRRVTVQPGVVIDHLNHELAPAGLKFAPDPASSNRATVGGAIGNNSTGAHSVRYGITDAYAEELEVVLANGERIHTRDVVLDSPEYEEIIERDDFEADLYRTVRGLVEDNESEIERRYPDLKRTVSGYNLQKVIRTAEQTPDADGNAEVGDGEDGDEAERRIINLSKLFVGAEGTLGIVVEATLSLVTRPTETALAVYCFDDLQAALRAVPTALEHHVSAVELMDEEVFRLARASDGYAEYAEPIPEETAAALMVEWDDELIDADELIEDDIVELAAGKSDAESNQRAAFKWAVDDLTEELRRQGPAFDHLEAYSDTAQAQLWNLRKAAIPLLMSLEGDPKPYPFIEDATVPPAELAEYVGRFQDILADHDTTAAYFAHAGSGTLHIRPILTLKDESGVETMHSITEAVTDLVLDHQGAFSGEHGDGMARTEFTPKMYGGDLWQAFKALKTAFDPEWRLHPGNVVYRDGPDDVGPDNHRGVGADMREHLRYGPAYSSLEPQTTLDFDDDGGFSHLVELCNGCGTCRQTDADVMCPTYRASGEEIQSTRGRANLLRAAISGELEEKELTSDRFHSAVLDWCVGCKGCKSDCPTGVDLAKLKAEIKHLTHHQAGASRRDRLFANIDRYAALGSRLSPLSNAVASVPGSRWLLDRFLGIAPERPLPAFQRETFCDWHAARTPRDGQESQIRNNAILFPDTMTNYHDPEAGKAAVSVLEAAGVEVRVGTDLVSSGRAAYSLGFLDQAREAAETNVNRLVDRVDAGWDVLFVEPSDAVMFQDEYLDLVAGEEVQRVSEAAYGVMEYLDRKGLVSELSVGQPGESLAYHGHCHQHALNRDHHAPRVLTAVGYDVDVLDSGCCGMAGSFGYEAEHYDLSMAIGRLLKDQIEASGGTQVVAAGTSCRAQIRDLTDDSRPPHPIELVEAALE